jgi:hypothetical protein
MPAVSSPNSKQLESRGQISFPHISSKHHALPNTEKVHVKLAIIIVGWKNSEEMSWFGQDNPQISENIPKESGTAMGFDCRPTTSLKWFLNDHPFTRLEGELSSKQIVV